MPPPSPTGAGPPPGTPACAASAGAASAQQLLQPQQERGPYQQPCAPAGAADGATNVGGGGGGTALLGLRLVGVRGWRFSQQAEDIEWLMLFASPDGYSRASAWQVVYSIADRQQWDEIQRFLLPQLTVLRSLMRSMLFGAAGFLPPP
ncbi:hypothetical protein MNEG_13888, partial [Monoraphidium neglectum]